MMSSVDATLKRSNEEWWCYNIKRPFTEGYYRAVRVREYEKRSKSPIERNEDEATMREKENAERWESNIATVHRQHMAINS